MAERKDAIERQALEEEGASSSVHLAKALQAYDNVTPRSQYVEYYSRHGLSPPKNEDLKDSDRSRRSASDREMYKEIEAEIRMHKELGMVVHSVCSHTKTETEQAAIDGEQHNSALPEDDQDNAVQIDDYGQQDLSEGRDIYEQKANFITSDDCSIADDILYGRPDRESDTSEASICGSLYATRLMEKDTLTSTKSSISVTSVQQSPSPENA